MPTFHKRRQRNSLRWPDLMKTVRLFFLYRRYGFSYRAAARIAWSNSHA